MAFVLIAALLIGIAVVLPFALRSVLEEILDPPEGTVYTLALAPDAPAAANHSRLHISLVDLDEARLLATLRVSGHHVCRTSCPYTERIVLFSLGTNEALTAGMPPSAKVDLTTSEQVVSDTVNLPVRGSPSR